MKIQNKPAKLNYGGPLLWVQRYSNSTHNRVNEYSPLKISVLTCQQPYGTVARSTAFTLARDGEVKHNLVAAILKEYLYFYE